ncbi:hypothetical protein Y032_0492g2415 [Ancylostoma ceylanicum]|uniref:Uncharacterized protein n=1 Tax=Ancylostoma ceylanicum TaxID=53326 RepID=A0A016WUX2_9BILA|nr:hypothetical protein Y032_0492g2415 [Ancylostoma ceylanicum]
MTTLVVTTIQTSAVAEIAVATQPSRNAATWRPRRTSPVMAPRSGLATELRGQLVHSRRRSHRLAFSILFISPPRVRVTAAFERRCRCDTRLLPRTISPPVLSRVATSVACRPAAVVVAKSLLPPPLPCNWSSPEELARRVGSTRHIPP